MAKKVDKTSFFLYTLSSIVTRLQVKISKEVQNGSTKV